MRSLSAAERNLAARVFGAALDISRVRLLDEEHWASRGARLLGRGRQAVVRGDRIFAPGAPVDFCLHGGAAAGFLCHELTHVWQYQTGRLTLLRYALAGDWRYDYALEPGRDFFAYGFEQQASIVEDYVRLLHEAPPRHANTIAKLSDYRALLPFGAGAGQVA